MTTKRGPYKKRNPLERFLKNCRFDPITGCVIWIGGQTMGRGHRAPYGAFWFEGVRWFAHRWAAKFVHGLDIDDMQVDHACPYIPHPNTLCVEHVQALTPSAHSELEVRRKFIHLQVGLVNYRDAYGVDELDNPALTGGDPYGVPFHIEPEWLSKGVNSEAGQKIAESLGSTYRCFENQG